MNATDDVIRGMVEQVDALHAAIVRLNGQVADRIAADETHLRMDAEDEQLLRLLLAAANAATLMRSNLADRLPVRSAEDNDTQM